MKFRDLLKKQIRKRQNQQKRRRRKTRASRMEMLEPRMLLAADLTPILVTAHHDITDLTDGETTLREAIDLANTDPSLSRIEFALSDGVGKIELDQNQSLSVDSDIELFGNGRVGIVSIGIRPGTPTAIRIFEVQAGRQVEFRHVSVEDGNPTTGNGGGILNAGDLTLTESMVRGNVSPSDGGGIFSTDGSSLTLSGSTLADNIASGDGGGLYLSQLSSAIIDSSTISGNTAATGGGILVDGTAAVSDTTIVDNDGGGMASAGVASITNSIVASNALGFDATGTYVSGGFNLLGDASASSGWSNDDLQGNVGGQGVIDPLISELSNFGGGTWTHALLPGSPAIDQGLSSNDTDQRGAPRVLDGIDADISDINPNADIGAFEFGTFVVNEMVDGIDGTPLGDGLVDSDPATDGYQVTLRSATQEINRLGGWEGVAEFDRVQFDAFIMFEVDALSMDRLDANDDLSISGDFDIAGNVTLVGASLDLEGVPRTWLEVLSDPYQRIGDRAFHVLPGASLELRQFGVTGARAYTDSTPDSGLGGVIFNDGGTVRLVNSATVSHAESPQVITSNYADRLGGGIYSRNGAVEIIASIVGGNEAADGGGIYLDSGTLSIDNSRIDFNRSQRGGGLYLDSGTIDIDNSTISGNVILGTAGGGIYNLDGSVTIGQSVVGENWSDYDGQETISGVGIHNAGTLVVDNSRITGNFVEKQGSIGSGIFNSHSLVVRDSRIDANGNDSSSTLDGGSGIFNRGGDVHLHTVVVEANETYGYGGGLYNENGQVLIESSRFSSNSSFAAASAIYNVDLDAELTLLDTQVERNLGYYSALRNLHGSVTIDGSTFADNSATYAGGGAIEHHALNHLLAESPQQFITLDAAVNTTQNVVFVSDLSPLDGLPLPIDITISHEEIDEEGRPFIVEEWMTVNEIDELRSALLVYRTNPIRHSVADPVNLALSERQQYIKVGDPSVFTNYELPLDIVVTSDHPSTTAGEVLTVIDINDDVLTVLRGRNGTPSVRHRLPMRIWGVPGELSIINSTFSGNVSIDVSESLAELDRVAVIENLLHPYAPTTVIENTTFNGNVSDGGATILTKRGIDIGPYAESYPDSALWHDQNASLFMQNNVIADSRDPLGQYPVATHVISEGLGRTGDYVLQPGTVLSGGNNLLSYDQVNHIRLYEDIFAGDSTLVVSKGGSIPPLPFPLRISRLTGDELIHEEVLVTSVENDPDDWYRTFTVLRGQSGTEAVDHLITDQDDGIVRIVGLTVSRSGFSVPGDKHGSNDEFVVPHETVLMEPSGISKTATVLRIADASDLPDVPFSIRVSFLNGLQVVHEKMLVTDVKHNALTVIRGINDTAAIDIPNLARVDYSHVFGLALDPQVGPLDGNGGTSRTHEPLNGSPLLETGSRVGFDGATTLLQSSIADSFEFQSPAYFSVDATFGYTVPSNTFEFSHLDRVYFSDLSAFPAAPFLMRVNDEVMRVTEFDTEDTALVVERGLFGTEIIDHQDGAMIYFGAAPDETSTTLHVSDTTGLPQTPFVVSLRGELARVTSVDHADKLLTLDRAQFGTEAEDFEQLAPMVMHGDKIEVSTTSQLPAGRFLAQIGHEVVLVHQIDDEHNVLTLQRATNRSTLGEHRAGVTIEFDALLPHLAARDEYHFHPVLGYNGRYTVLTADVTAVDQTEIVVESRPPIAPALIELKIGTEEFQVLSETSNEDGTTTLQVARGYNDSTALAAHVAGSVVHWSYDARVARRGVDVDMDGVSQMDIGAVESAVYLVNSDRDAIDLVPGDGMIDTGIDDEITLRAAIMEANTTAGFATIHLPEGEFTLTGVQSIIGGARIIGAGAGATIIRGDGDRIFNVESSGMLRLSGVTLRDGESQGDGGAVLVQGGTLEVWNSVFTENDSDRGAIANEGGTIQITGSTLHSNTANYGGAIANLSGDLELRNVTISGNVANSEAGAILNESPGTVRLLNSTVYQNLSIARPGLVNRDGEFYVANTIVSGHHMLLDPDLHGSFLSGGNNLIGVLLEPTASLNTDISAEASRITVENQAELPQVPFMAQLDDELIQVIGIEGDELLVLRAQGGTIDVVHSVGTGLRIDGFWHQADLTGSESTPLDAQLSPLQDNYGPTPNHAIALDSPAVDAGRVGDYTGPQVTLGLNLHRLDDRLMVTDWETLPVTPFDIMVGDELMTVVTQDGPHLTVKRNVAVGHNSGTPVTVMVDQRGAPRIDEIIVEGGAPTGDANDDASDDDASDDGTTGDTDDDPGDDTGGDTTGDAGDDSEGDTDNDTTSEAEGEQSAPIVSVVPVIDIGAYELVPELSITAVTPELVELDEVTDVTTFEFSVTRTGNTAGKTTVDYYVVRTAEFSVSPTDFVGDIMPSGTIIFEDGETSKTILLDVSGDRVVEADEEFGVLLTDASRGGWIVEPIAYATILDTDTATISVNDPAVPEGSSLVFEFSFDHDVEGGFELPIHTVDGTATEDEDYTSIVDTLEFSGDSDEVESAVIRTVQDNIVERDEILDLFVTSLVGIPVEIVDRITVDMQATGTIENDDSTSLSVEDVKLTEGDDGTKSFDFGLRLTQPVDIGFSVVASTLDLSSTTGSGDPSGDTPGDDGTGDPGGGGTGDPGAGGDGSGSDAGDDPPAATGDIDYITSSTTVNFAGSGGEVQAVSIDVYGDLELEADEVFAVILDSLQASGREEWIELADGAGTILNDDSPRFIVGQASVLEGPDDTTTTLSFPVELVNATGVPVSVDAVTVAGTATQDVDYTHGSTTLDFSGVDGEVLYFDVTVQGDLVIEADETLTVALSNVQGVADPTIFDVVDGVGTIRNDDVAELTLRLPTEAPIPENVGEVTVDVLLSEPLDVDLTIVVTTHEETATADVDFTYKQSTITFPAGTTSKPFVVSIVDDTLIEVTETFSVTLGGLEANGREVSLGNSAVIVIADIDKYVRPPGGIDLVICGVNHRQPPADDDTSIEGESQTEDGVGSGDQSGADDDADADDGSTPDGSDEDSGDSGGGGEGGDTPGGSEGNAGGGDGYNQGLEIDWYSDYEDPATLGPIGTPDEGAWTESTSWIAGATGCAVQDELFGEPEEDPIPEPSEYVAADWVVPHTGELTFNPFPTFNYIRGGDVAVTIVRDDGSLAKPGETVTLEYGTLTINPSLHPPTDGTMDLGDGTVTYRPLTGLRERVGDDRLYPEQDAFGNTVRMTGFDNFELHLATAADFLLDVAEAVMRASRYLSLAVSNHLPSQRGDHLHQPDNDISMPDPYSHAQGIFYTDAPIFIDHQETVRVDLVDLFADVDGEIDLEHLEIVDVLYGSEFLDSSDPDAEPAFVDDEPHQISFPIGAVRQTTVVIDPNLGIPISEVETGRTEYDLVLTHFEDSSIIEFESFVSATETVHPKWTTLEYPTRSNFFVVATDGQQRPKRDEDGEWMFDEDDNPIAEEMVWVIDLQIRPNVYATDAAYEATTNKPSVVTTPWVKTVTSSGGASDDSSSEDDSSDSSDSSTASNDDSSTDDSSADDSDEAVQLTEEQLKTGLDIVSESQIKMPIHSELVGNTDVDLLRGTLRRYHDLQLDISGGGSEQALAGFIYDSSTVNAAPVVFAALQNSTGELPESVDYTLTWYGDDGPENSSGRLVQPGETDGTPILDTRSEYVVGLRAGSIPTRTGVYGWTMEATFNFGEGQLATVETHGDTSVIVADDSNPFGNGWHLAGVPTVTLDHRRDQVGGSDEGRLKNSRILLHMPGDEPKVFNAADLLSAGDPTVELLSLQAGGTEHNGPGPRYGLEFGKLTAFKGTSELVGDITYDDSTGREYIFKAQGLPGEDGEHIYLLDRIEPPSVEYIAGISAQRQGTVSFEWSDKNEFGVDYADSVSRLQYIVASDGAKSRFVYDSGNSDVLSAIELYATETSTDSLLTTEFTVANDELRSIKVSSASSIDGDESVDRIREFDYDDSSLMTEDRWLSDATLERKTRFEWSDDDDATDDYTLKMITLGDTTAAGLQNQIEYQIKSAADRAERGWSVGGLISGEWNVFSDQERYDVDAGDEEDQRAIDNHGFYFTKSEFDVHGLLRVQTSQFQSGSLDDRATLDATEDARVDLLKSEYKYDHVGALYAQTDAVGRTTTHIRDYHNPVDASELLHENLVNEVKLDLSQYDPDDYRGNVTYLVDVAGLTLFQYETDDEGGAKQGKLKAVVRHPKFRPEASDGEKWLASLLGGMSQQTYYVHRSDGQLESIHQIRGEDDRKSDTDEPLKEKDHVEKWTYNADDYLETHESALGLITTYSDFLPGGVPKTMTVLDPIAKMEEMWTTEFTPLGLPDQTLYSAVSGTAGVLLITDRDYYSDGSIERTSEYRPNPEQENDEDDLADNELLARSSWRYSADGRVASHFDGKETETRHKYDLAGVLVATTEGVGATYFNNAVGATQSIEQNTTLEHYADGSLRRVNAPGGVVTSYYASPVDTFDLQLIFPMRHGETLPVQSTWTVTHGVAGQSTIESGVADPPIGTYGNVAIKEDQFNVTRSDVHLGRVVAAENELTKQSEYYYYKDTRHDVPTYTQTSRMVTSTRAVGDLRRLVFFDSTGNTLFDMLQDRDNSVHPPVVSQYDELGYLTRQTQPTYIPRELNVETDPAGNIVFQSEVLRYFDPAPPVESGAKYDAHGRPVILFDPIFVEGAKKHGIQCDPVDCGAPTTIARQFGLDGLLVVQTIDRIDPRPVNDARSTSYEFYNPLGQHVQSVNNLGGTTKRTYDMTGMLTDVEFVPDDAAAATHDEYKYDALGRLRKEISHFSHLGENREPVSTLRDYFDEEDSPWDVVVTNTHGGVTAQRFDSVGKLVASMNAPSMTHDPGDEESNANTVTLYVYEYGPGTVVTTYLSSSDSMSSLSNGTLKMRTRPYAEFRQSEHVLDFDGQVMSTRTTPDGATFFTQESLVRDGLGRVTRRIDSAGQKTTFVYDDHKAGTGLMRQQKHYLSEDDPETDDINEEIAKFVHFEYDTLGNRRLKTERLGTSGPNDSLISWFYDSLGRVTDERTRVWLSGDTDELHSVDREWSYYGNATTYKDRNGKYIVEVVSPESGIHEEYWVGAADSSETARSLFGLGKTVIATHLASDFSPVLVRQQSLTGPTTTSTFDYDSPYYSTETVNYSFAAFGGASPPDIRARFTQDSTTADRVVTQTLVGDGDGDLIATSALDLDHFGRVLSQQVDYSTGDAQGIRWPDDAPSDISLSFDYTRDGRIEREEWTQASSPNSTSFDKVGYTSYTYLGHGIAESITHQLWYDDANGEAQSWTIGGHDFGMDEFGNLEGRESYARDLAGNETYLGSMISESQADARVNDRWGNAEEWRVERTNRLADDGVHTYVYDREGRVTWKGVDDDGTAFIWDQRGRLSKQVNQAGNSVEIIHYEYDGLDRRIAKTVETPATNVPTRWTGYIGDTIEYGIDGTIGRVWTKNIVSGTFAAVHQASPEGHDVVWLFPDENGTVRSLAYFNEDWIVGHRAFGDYGEFGAGVGAYDDPVIAAVTPIWRNMKYDVDTNGYVAGNIVFDPENGRSLTDTVGDGSRYVLFPQKSGEAEPSTFLPRVFGSIEVLGGAAQIATGVSLCLGSGFLGCGFAAIMIVNGAEHIIAGAITVETGRHTKTGSFEFVEQRYGTNAAFAADIAMGLGGSAADDFVRAAGKSLAGGSTRSAARRVGLVHAGKHLGVAASTGGAFGAAGYYLNDRSWDSALMWGMYGSMAGSMIATKYVTCFVAGTPVWIPSDEEAMPPDVAYAAAAPISDKLWSRWETFVGLGLIATGVVGWSAAQKKRVKQPKTGRMCSDRDALFGDECLDELLDDILRPIEPALRLGGAL